MFDHLDIRAGKTTFADMAYRAILEGIVSHKLAPGSSLRAKELAEVLNISRTPIERALERLAGEGLVEFRPGLGPYVAEPSVSEILDLYDARMMLETHAIAEGIDRIDNAFLGRLLELIDRREEACRAIDGSYEMAYAAKDAGREPHLHVMSLSRNQRLLTWYRQVSVHIQSFRLVNIPSRYRPSSAGERVCRS